MIPIVRFFKSTTNAIFRSLNTRAQQNAFRREHRIDFYRAMYLYQRAGARKLIALQLLNDTYSTYLSPWQRMGNKLLRLMGRKQPMYTHPIAAVAETALLHRNVTLAEALKNWLPLSERAILASGEHSGNLVGAFEMAGRFARRQGGMWSKVFSAFAHPLALIAGIMGVLYAIAGVMLPIMEVSNTSAFSPWAQFVLWMASIVHEYWFLAIAIPILSTVAVLSSLSRWKGAWRVKADRYPPWSFYRRIHGALFLYSYAVLQKSGVSVPASLASLAEQANPWLKARITAAMYGVRQGYNIGKSFRNAGHDFPDWEALPVIETICTLTGAADALIEYAENWLEDTSNYIDKFIKRINAAMRFWMFFWIGLLAITILEIISTSFR